MRPISIVFPFYRNQGMLARQYRVMAEEWRDDQKAALEVIIVDDGSLEPALDVPRPSGLPALRLYRITENRPWHQHGARNLGAAEASHHWLAMLDIDHVIPPSTLDAILQFEPPKRDFALTFSRRDAPVDSDWLADDVFMMKPTIRVDGTAKPHVNSFVLKRDLYWQVGGYDEDLCGIYGTDKHFLRRLYEKAAQFMIDAPLIRVDRAAIADASTRDQPRKEGRRPGEKKAAIAARLAAKKAEGRIAPKILDFPWERQL